MISRVAATTSPLSHSLSLSHLFSSLQHSLHIHQLEDWYDVPVSHVRKLATGKLRNATEALVRAEYPNHSWDSSKFVKHTGTRALQTPQTFLGRIIKTIFPNYEIEKNVRKKHGVTNTTTGAFLEIDIYIPKLKIGFEYQDPHHYFQTKYGATLQEYQARDIEKEKRMKEHGIDLIKIPFWWRWDIESLIATIKRDCPRIVSFIPDNFISSLSSFSSSSIVPFQNSPPQEVLEKWSYGILPFFSFEKLFLVIFIFFDLFLYIPDMGSPMLAMYLPLTKSFNPKNWIVFEKYDGVRTIWHPLQRKFYSRWGKQLSLPLFAHDSMPPLLWLDGEIWFGRERHTRYQALKLSAAKSQENGGVWGMGIEWNKLKYMVFDSPTPIISDMSYVMRHKFLKDEISTDHPIVEVPSYEICNGRESLEQKFFEIRAREGEGIILRDPDAPYVKGYSRHIYKHRGYLDAEAMVLHKLDSNTFVCRVPKLHLLHNVKSDEPNNEENNMENKFHEVEMTIDQDLFVGKVEDIKEKDIVSFRYTGEQRQVGPPMNPRIYCIRPDIASWQQLIKSKLRKAPDHQQIWSPPLQVNDWKDPNNRKKFFDDFAHSLNFNPLKAENWYKISGTDISNVKGGESLLNKYSGSFINAVVDVYPNVTFDISKFKNLPMNFWANEDNVTKFFNSFAKEHKFDPLVANNWYQITRDQILKKKGGSGVLKHFRSHVDAIIRSYPFINIDPLQFSSVPNSFWEIQENRKNFFDKYAENNEFDPLNPLAWDEIENRDIEEEKGGNQVLSFYNKSLKQALADLYCFSPSSSSSSSSSSSAKRKTPLSF